MICVFFVRSASQYLPRRPEFLQQCPGQQPETFHLSGPLPLPHYHSSTQPIHSWEVKWALCLYVTYLILFRINELKDFTQNFTTNTLRARLLFGHNSFTG